MSEPTIRVDSLNKFRPQRQNLNKHNSRGRGMLDNSMQTDGFVAPITTASDGEVIDGSLRLEESGRVFGDEVLVVEHDGTRPIVMVRTDIPTADEPIAKHIAVAANRIAEVDLTIDTEVLRQLQADDASLLADLFDPKEMMELLKEQAVGEIGDEAETMEQVESELDGVRSLKDYVLFASDLPYEIPPLLPEKIYDGSFDMQVWAGPRLNYETKTEQWLYIWGSDSIKTLDLTKTVISFYTDDHRFENFWFNPSEYTGKLINCRVPGVVMPNFSMYWGMPRALRIYQKYRSNWCARYFQEAGLSVLPDVQMSPEDGELCWAGIPIGAPISMQFHTKLSEDSWRKKLDFCRVILDAIKPERILAYSDERGWKKLQDAGLTRGMTLVKSRVSVRRELMDSVAKEVI